MIIESHGNLLHAGADALVNTVNTQGVMGKGIALQFKKAFPAMFDAYRRAAKAGEVHLGRVQVWETGHLNGPRYVINFPTKGHWKEPSKLADIEAGLADLVHVVQRLDIKSIAIPPLGCGNGGLDWRLVEPAIREAFAGLPGVEVLLYAPEGAPPASALVVSTERPRMTAGRAVLIDMIGRYTEQALAAPGVVESQKLMYFLQSAGEPLSLRFAANRYGPYADNLRHALIAIEGHYLVGFGDGSASVDEAEPLRLLAGAAEEASAVLAEAPDSRLRVDRVLELASGFESAYGLELLATVHWIATHEAASDVTELTQRVRDWSPRKARLFTDRHVNSALSALQGRGWLPAFSPAECGAL